MTTTFEEVEYTEVLSPETMPWFDVSCAWCEAPPGHYCQTQKGKTCEPHGCRCHDVGITHEDNGTPISNRRRKT